MKKALARLRLPVTLKAVRELGPAQSYWYADYQASVRSGSYRLRTPPMPYPVLAYPLSSPFGLPERDALAELLGDQVAALIAEADEVTFGQMRLFSGPPVALQLIPPDAHHHWSVYEGRPALWGVEDIKYIWEPARFGWVYPLGRAYLLTGNEKYAVSFWQHFETFINANPVNMGPNWLSAQEVALRLLALLFAARVFDRSLHSIIDRKRRLTGAIAVHAGRIPPTLNYARAQNNNHRISEALGLYAAGSAIPDHPQARKWRELGWNELNQALLSQIDPDGVYMQHSMNYHRLMLHEALLASLFGRAFPAEVSNRLAAATTWLLAQVDPQEGKAPNLGSNDGANILPLAAAAQGDFRPVAQAAARVFLKRPAFAAGLWDELGLWLNLPAGEGADPLTPAAESPGVHRLSDGATGSGGATGRDGATGSGSVNKDGSANSIGVASWGTLRAAQFHSRPAHADQLHVELWWHGDNVALDAGTYRYTAADPWNNALTQTCVHNTIEVDGQNQMTHAGRFLWLDWAQARLVADQSADGKAITAEHDGYAHLGVLHRRTLKLADPGHWQVIDRLLQAPISNENIPANPVYPYTLQWLLPDWPWQLNGLTLILSRPRGGELRLTLSPELPTGAQSKIDAPQLVRAGQVLSGAKNAPPILGWYAPTYGYTVPALSFSISVRAALPFNLMSNWQFLGGQ